MQGLLFYSNFRVGESDESQDLLRRYGNGFHHRSAGTSDKGVQRLDGRNRYHDGSNAGLMAGLHWPRGISRVGIS